MALATRCPHCATTFRVAHDQLKLRAGLVRCGACKQIFNGVENLLGPEVPAPAKPSVTPASPPPRTPSGPSAPPSPPPAAAGTPAVRPPFAPNSGIPAAAGSASPDSLRLSPPTTAFPLRARALPAADEADQDVDPLTRMTLMDFTFIEEGSAPSTHIPDSALGQAAAPPASDAEAPDEIEQAIEDLHSRPWRGESVLTATSRTGQMSDDSQDEPGFVKHARRRQKVGSTLKWMYGLGSLVLALLLAGQLAYGFRDQLAQRLPQSTPYLQQACSHLNCRISYPTPIESLAIESSELQAIPTQPDTFMLRVLLRNRYDTTVAWPHMELTLNDGDGKPVARRSFPPAEYLTETEQVQTGFSAQSEHAVALRFMLRQVQASGFRVYLFYP